MLMSANFPYQTRPIHFAGRTCRSFWIHEQLSKLDRVHRKGDIYHYEFDMALDEEDRAVLREQDGGWPRRGGLACCIMLVRLEPRLTGLEREWNDDRKNTVGGWYQRLSLAELSRWLIDGP